MSSETAVKEAFSEADKIIAEEQAKEERRKAESNSTLDEIKKRIEDTKASNDALERELLRQEELRAKMMAGGKAYAGKSTEKTDEQKAQEEAAELVKTYR